MKYKDTAEITKYTVLQKILSHPFIVVAGNWLFQGMRYMETGERIIKLTVTLTTSLLVIILALYSKGSISFIEATISFIFGHTLNWIFNGQIFVLLRYLPVKGNMTLEKMKSFINIIQKLALRTDSLQAVLIFGSLSRGEVGVSSDLDVRIMRRKGLINALHAYILAIKLRFLAFVKAFPLDIYTFADISFLWRLKADEEPVVVINNGFVENYYKNYSDIKDILKQVKFRDA